MIASGVSTVSTASAALTPGIYTYNVFVQYTYTQILLFIHIHSYCTCIHTYISYYTRLLLSYTPSSYYTDTYYYTSIHMYTYIGISYYTTTTGNVISSGVPFGQAPLVTPAYQIGMNVCVYMHMSIFYVCVYVCIYVHVCMHGVCICIDISIYEYMQCMVYILLY